MKLRPSVLNPEWRAALATRVVNRLARWAGVKTAVLAGYKAGEVSRTRQLHTNYGTNPNTSMAQIERVRMQWTGEFLAKNVPFVTAYLKTRAMYCAPLAWVPNTGDTGLDEELAEYLREHWEDGGINCSMWDAFTRTVDCEQPVRGDAGLIWYRDENRYRLMEFSADQLGELWTFQNPSTNLAGTTYFAGRYFAPNGQCVAYKVYQRGFNQVYCNPENYDAADVLYFQDNLFRGVRGITTFHSAILSVEKADRLFQSGMDAATKQASREGFVFNERGQPDEGTYESDQYMDGSVTYFQRAMDGTTTEYMFKGDSYQAMEPTMPGEELIKGVESAKEEACLALGFPYSFLINATKVGGAPSRLEVNRAGKEITRLHRSRMSALEKIAYVTIMDAVDRGIFPPVKSIDKGHWQFPNLPTADAFRDAKDDVMSLRYGLDSAQRILGRYGESFPVILEENTQAAIAIAKKVQDANRQLKREGYEPTITALDIAQRTENPAQAAESEALERGQPPESNVVPFGKAAASAYVGDLTVSQLPKSVQDEIARILGTNGDTAKLVVVKYGMTVPELVNKADPHNYEAAQKHIRYCTNGACADEVYANEDKVILMMNDRIIDGHHYLAKAEKGKISKSLPVVDLTPTRFQM